MVRMMKWYEKTLNHDANTKNHTKYKFFGDEVGEIGGEEIENYPENQKYLKHNGDTNNSSWKLSSNTQVGVQLRVEPVQLQLDGDDDDDTDYWWLQWRNEPATPQEKRDAQLCALIHPRPDNLLSKDSVLV